MIYFRKHAGYIEKYNVTFDKEKINNIRTLIINNCSKIIRGSVKTTLPEMYEESLKYRNIVKRFTGIRDYEQGADLKEYTITFYEYIFPSLVGIIDNLLRGETKAVDELINYKDPNPENYDELIKRTSKELDTISNFDIAKKRKKLDELEMLLELKALNKNQKPIKDYYERLLTLITFELLDFISEEEASRVNNFYSSNEEEVKRTLKDDKTTL